MIVSAPQDRVSCLRLSGSGLVLLIVAARSISRELVLLLTDWGARRQPVQVAVEKKGKGTKSKLVAKTGGAEVRQWDIMKMMVPGDVWCSRCVLRSYLERMLKWSLVKCLGARCMDDLAILECISVKAEVPRRGTQSP